MSKKQKRLTVHIENPAPGGSHWTTRNRALRYIRDGRAEFTADKTGIRFVAHRYHATVTEISTRPAKPVYTDGTGMATLAAVEGLPVVGNAIVVFTRKAA